jgi:hypothetical protein
MTDLERLELVLRRVHSDLNKTPRFATSDHLVVLRQIIRELLIVNNEQAKLDQSAKAAALAGEIE